MAEFKDLLSRIDRVKIGVIGDFCVDIYWHADMKKSELSRETPHFPLPVYQEQVYLGAAGNVTANIAALKPEKVFVCGIRGDDWRGMLMESKFAEIGADITGLVCEKSRMTNAYCKPIRHGLSDTVYEDPRLDFCANQPITAQSEERIIEEFKKMAEKVDVICVCDQFENGVITEKVRNLIGEIGKSGKLIVVDSRSNIGKYTCVTVKPNETEFCRAFGINSLESSQYETYALNFANAKHCKVLLTMGADGCIYCNGQNTTRVPAKKVEGPIDICGAGDTFNSAFSCMSATGCDPVTCAKIASAASAVTVKKIGVTGTATREEILKLFE